MRKNSDSVPMLPFVEDGNTNWSSAKKSSVEWVTTRLLDVTRHHSGNGKLIKGKLSDAPAEGLFPAFSASGQDVWRDGFEHEGDAVVVSAVGARCGKCFLASGKWSAVANTHVVWPIPDLIDRKFLWYRVNDEQFWVRSGSAQPFVVVRKTFERPFLLPPLIEQRRMVAEIEKQFTRLEAGATALRQVQAKLKRYRAAVLKAACEGTLVPTEAKWPRKPISNAIRSLDQGWSPKCENDPANDDKQWAVIKTTAIQPLRFLTEENKRLPESLKPRKHLELQAGDLLITRAGPRSRAGVTCLVKSTRPHLMLCDKAYRIRCDENVASAAFLEIVLNSPDVLDALNELKTGINDSGVNLTQSRFNELVVPLPPVGEQTRIVAEVERRLSVVEELEVTVAANLKRSARLRQSILQRAFTGRLLILQK